jgi:2-oxoglutarate dehydrogenase E2 component (dihydrolipoamide succinyltransferase)
MALVEIKVPSVGESVTEALLSQWYREDGAQLRRDEALFVLETDKVTLEVTAAAAGRLKIAVVAGTTVKIGAVVGSIDTESAAAAPDTGEKPAGKPGKGPAPEAKPVSEPQKKTAPQGAPAAEGPSGESRPAKAASEPEPAPPPERGPSPEGLPPSVRRLVAEHGLDPGGIAGTGPGGRVTKGDVLLFLERRAQAPAPAARAEADGEPACPPGESVTEEITRKPMTPIRRRIAEHLLKARQNTAMLTTFNDIDMRAVMELRGRYKEPFKKKYGVSLGFMSFFIKASVEALKAVPEINAAIDGTDIVYHHYHHIGVAVGSKRGLVVPVIRHAGRLGFAELEQAIVDFVARIDSNRLTLQDLSGGTFTITNGGVFGSLLSTPILNTPQSGILGMHRIEKRPVVVEDQVVIRPMMYVALSYDHRIVDGREAVTFLKHVKECIEDPERIMMEI